MDVNGEQVAVRRATALGHFVPGFSFRIVRGSEILVEVGQGLSEACHPVIGACEFRWSVTQAVSTIDDVQVARLFHANGTTPLRVDWAMAPPARLSAVGLREAKIHQNGLVEVVLGDGGHRWVFSTLIDPDTVGEIVRHLAMDPGFSVIADGVYDDGLEITMVVVAPVPGADVSRARGSVQDVLGETMAQELLHEAAGRAWT